MKISVLIIEPFKLPRTAVIENNYKAISKVVGGRIEAVYPFDDLVVIINNEVGKIEGLPLNRGIRGIDGVLYDAVAGTFIICGIKDGEEGEEWISLSPELMKKYRKLFRNPEIFFNVDGKIISIPMIPVKRK